MAKKKPNGGSSRSHSSLASVYQLLNLFIDESAASRPKVRSSGPPGLVNLFASFSVGKTTEPPDHFMATVTHGIEATYEAGGEVAVRITGKFLLLYKPLRPVESDLDKEQIIEFGKTLALVDSWPYWRDFTQWITTAMGMPPIRLPIAFPSNIEFK